MLFESIGRPCEQIGDGVLLQGFSMVFLHLFLTIEEYFERITFMVNNPDKLHWFYEGVTCSIGLTDDAKTKSKKNIRCLTKEKKFKDLCKLLDLKNNRAYKRIHSARVRNNYVVNFS